MSLSSLTGRIGVLTEVVALVDLPCGTVPPRADAESVGVSAFAFPPRTRVLPNRMIASSNFPYGRAGCFSPLFGVR
eukprot:1256597-Amphidinium_carterae.2